MHKYEIARPTRICCSYVSYYSLLTTYSCIHVDRTVLCSSQFIVYGRDPVLPMDTLLQPRPKYMGEDYVPCMLERLSFCLSAPESFCHRQHLKHNFYVSFHFFVEMLPLSALVVISDKKIQLISIVFGNVLKLVDKFAVHFDVVSTWCLEWRHFP